MKKKKKDRRSVEVIGGPVEVGDRRRIGSSGRGAGKAAVPVVRRRMSLANEQEDRRWRRRRRIALCIFL